MNIFALTLTYFNHELRNRLSKLLETGSILDGTNQELFFTFGSECIRIGTNSAHVGTEEELVFLMKYSALHTFIDTCHVHWCFYFEHLPK